MTNEYNLGDRVTIHSTVFNFDELFDRGTIVGVVGAPHWYMVRLDRDGTIKKWSALHLRRVV